MSDRDKIIEVMARAEASFEEIEYVKYRELFNEQAAHVLAALDAAGLAVVAAEDVRRMRGALEALQLFHDHYPHGINPWLDEAHTKARAALATKETEG